MNADDWSLDEHLRRGEVAITMLLMSSDIDKTDPRVCFHFEPVEWNESEPWNEEASFNQRAKPLFDALSFHLNIDYVGGTTGIEAWETVIPSIKWLNERLPAFVDIASQSGLVFSGWSFEPHEPRDFSFVSCGPHLRVFNAYSPEGRAARDKLIQEQTDAVKMKSM